MSHNTIISSCYRNKTHRERCLRNQRRFRRRHRSEINRLFRLRYRTDTRWEKQLKDRFGITVERYWKIYFDQNGLCKICGKPQCVGTKLDVDHDHETGQVRGLLCRHCNAGIGLLKDSIVLIRKALRYLIQSSLKEHLNG